ncbi:MAG: DUF6055 domain-containing protein [Myxococcota bacterium]|nr:DUF6055 domain-containing protein [Myxococcota bacterium]
MWGLLLTIGTGLAAGGSPVPGVDGRLRCGLPSLLGELPRTRVPPTAPPVDRGEGKEERDALGSFPNLMTSENFVVKWGEDGDVDEEDVEALLEAFEVGWAFEVEDLGHAPPDGTDQYLFNVYLGDTGDGTPSGYGSAGYYYVDPEGWPLIVIALASLADEQWAAATAVHELYHAVQAATGAYMSGDGLWYWEATASWMEGEALPEDRYYALFLAGYAFLPHYRLHFFDYPDTGALQEYHQYGAFIFPRYLTEFLAGPELIRDSWMEAGDEEDPLAVLAPDLDALGASAPSVFGDFAAHNAVWDYAESFLYQEYLYSWDQSYPGEDQQLVQSVLGSGSDGWAEPPAETLPASYGYNVIRMADPERGTLRVAFEGDETGSEGSAAEFEVRVVVPTDDSYAYEAISLEQGTGDVELDIRNEDELWLVVSSVSSDSVTGETFGYRYLLEYPEGSGPLAGLGCACGSAGRRHEAGGGVVVGLFAFLVALARREQVVR